MTRTRFPVVRRPRAHALAAVLAIGLAAATLQPAQAEPLPPSVIAIIDYQLILREATAARSIREQIEERRRAYQEEIAAEEQRLHEAERELARQRTLLSAEAFAERRRAFEDDVGQVQRMVQQRRNELDEVSAVALDEVRDALVDVLSDLADEYEFNVVIPSSGVLVYKPEIDLTGEALGRLDANLPSVSVPERVD